MGGWFKMATGGFRSRTMMKIGRGKEGARLLLLWHAILDLNADRDRDGLLEGDDLTPCFLAHELSWWGFDEKEVKAGVAKLLDSGLLFQLEEGICIPGWMDYRPELTGAQRKANERAQERGLPLPRPDVPAWWSEFTRLSGACPLPAAQVSYSDATAVRQPCDTDTTPVRQRETTVEPEENLCREPVQQTVDNVPPEEKEEIDGREGGERAKRTLSPTDRTVPGSSSVGPGPAESRAAPSDSPGANGKPPGRNGRVSESWKQRLKRVGGKTPAAVDLFEQLIEHTAWTKSRDGHQAIDLALAMVQEGWTPHDWRDFLEIGQDHSGGKSDVLKARRMKLQNQAPRRALLAGLRRERDHQARARDQQRRANHLWGHLQQELEERAQVLADNTGSKPTEILRRLVAERYRLMLSSGERVQDGTGLGHMLTLEEIPEEYRVYLPSKVTGSKPIPSTPPKVAEEVA